VLLLFVQIVLFAGIAAVVGVSTSDPAVAIVLIVLNAGISVLAKLYLDNVNRHNLNEAAAEIKRTVDAIRNDEKWSAPIRINNEDMKEIFDTMAGLYENLREKEAGRTRFLNMLNTMTSNMEIEKLFEDLMPKLVENLKSNWGAFYLANNATGKLELKSALGFSKNIYNEFDLTIGEGLIGSAAGLTEITVLREIPSDTVFVTKTFLGKIHPKNIMIVPVINNDQLIGVLCLASIYEYTSEQMAIVNMLKYYLGIALGNCVIYERTKRLTNELQFQNSLIQSLNEELENKVSDRSLFLKNIIDSITDYSIYVIDKDGIVLEWNKGAEFSLGYSEEEVKGKHINVVYSDAEVKAGNVKRRIDMVNQHGQYTENGWRYKKDGTKYYAEIALFGLYNEHGELIGMTNVSKDITKLKIAENEIWFQKEFAGKLIEGSESALVITNAAGQIHFSNRRANDLLKTDNPAGQIIWDYIEAAAPGALPEKRVLKQDFSAKVLIKQTGAHFDLTVKAAKDELALHETYVFFFYREEQTDRT
jgi:PAS domain S-box-containing protein